MKADLVQIIIEATRELLVAEGRPADGLDEGTTLFGKEGLLDSMGLVSLIVAVEQAIEDRLGTAVALADEKALSQKSSPYRTVSTLAEYAAAGLQRGG